MNEEDVLKQLTPIFRKALGNNDLALSPELTKSQVDGWDSFATVRLLVDIENHFQIRRPLTNARNVSTMRDLIGLIMVSKGTISSSV